MKKVLIILLISFTFIITLEISYLLHLSNKKLNILDTREKKITAELSNNPFVGVQYDKDYGYVYTFIGKLEKLYDNTYKISSVVNNHSMTMKINENTEYWLQTNKPDNDGNYIIRFNEPSKIEENTIITTQWLERDYDKINQEYLVWRVYF